jgi:hypothetical protein
MQLKFRVYDTLWYGKVFTIDSVAHIERTQLSLALKIEMNYSQRMHYSVRFSNRIRS